MFKKKCKQPNPGMVIIPANHPNPPESHEIDAAYILARHYRTTVDFLVPADDYKRKSADIVMLNVQWEIKSPTGDSKSTIRNQFRRASLQSKCIIIDSRRTKLKFKDVEKSVLFEVKNRPYIKKLLFSAMNPDVRVISGIQCYVKFQR
jgi:hypothetical protein